MQPDTFLWGKIRWDSPHTFEALMRQDIESDTGFFFIDQNKLSATNLITSIPDEKFDRILRISLDSPDVSGRRIQLNPLELKDPDDRFLIIDSFLFMLTNHFSNNHKIGWGQRLEMLVRHTLHLLVSKPGATLKDFPQILIDEKFRNKLIAMCPHQPTLDFFEKRWDAFPYTEPHRTNGINRLALLSTPEIMPLFDVARSTISISDMITKGMFVIMDLDGKLSTDIANLVASVIINMFSVEGKQRFMQGRISKHTFNIYVDEGDSFTP